MLVYGALGRMGQEVLKAVSYDRELELVAAVDIKAKEPKILPQGSNKPVPLFDTLEPAINACDPNVMVDFSRVEATIPAVRTALEHNIRLVIGTTGLSNADHDEIERICRSKGIGAVVATNFSLAAMVMINLAKTASKYFDYAEIIELHHEQKVDAPSGTAISTAKAMVEARGREFLYASSKSETIEKSRGGEFHGIAMHSVRLPGQLAHQEIIFGAPGQTLRIKLDQISREAFMPSVIMAIKKTMELKKAVFGLDSLLGL